MKVCERCGGGIIHSSGGGPVGLDVMHEVVESMKRKAEELYGSYCYRAPSRDECANVSESETP